MLTTTLLILAVHATARPTLAQGRAVEPPRDQTERQDIETADDLLRELETADQGLEQLTATIAYSKFDPFAYSRQERRGTLQFQSVPRPGENGGESKPPKRTFGVRFTQLIRDGHLDEIERIYIFDGHWFAEKDPAERFMDKREVVRPGEEADPLRIGEGPFPIPIGQRRADLLERFNARLPEPFEGLEITPDMDDEERSGIENLRRFASDAIQLHLVPKAQFQEQSDHVEVRLWYKRDKTGRLLPRMARTLSEDGAVSTVQLINVKINENAELDPDIMSTEAPEGWDVQIRTWEGP
jgi:hypothetical protein